MIVLRTDLQEAGVKEQAEKVRKLLEAQGAVVAGVHEWGLRELAYIIQKERRGYYLLAEYTGAAAAVAELERTLKLSDVVLRFVTIRQDEDSPPVVPPQRDTDVTPSPELDHALQPDDDDLLSADAEVSDAD
jgi:small subunit ribosomal protein S6